MRKEVIYIAEDGKRFDNIIDCRNYEESLFLQNFIKKNNILFFDKNFEEIITDNSLMQLFDKAYYIYIEKEEFIDELNEKFIYYEFCPINEGQGEGWYMYNYDTDTWINLTAKKEFIDNILQKLPH